MGVVTLLSVVPELCLLLDLGTPIPVWIMCGHVRSSWDPMYFDAYFPSLEKRFDHVESLYRA